ncbi:unnamed protein product, partial [marine sediment metagenome]
MSDIDKAIVASRPEFEAMAVDVLGRDVQRDGLGEYSSGPTFHLWVGWCARLRSEHSTMTEIGYHRDNTIFCSLNMTPSQWQALSDAVCEWGELPEETIA